MKKSEIFWAIIRKVVEVCEVREVDILNGMKAQAVVDARSLVVQYCRRVGLANEDIAYYVLQWQGADISYGAIRRKGKMVDNLFRGYGDRCIQSRAFCLMSKEIAQWCSTEFNAPQMG